MIQLDRYKLHGTKFTQTDYCSQATITIFSHQNLQQRNEKSRIKMQFPSEYSGFLTFIFKPTRICMQWVYTIRTRQESTNPQFLINFSPATNKNESSQPYKFLKVHLPFHNSWETVSQPPIAAENNATE